MSGGGSVVVRRQLGSKLRQLRLASGKKVTDVTEAGIASKAKMSRIEAGQTPVKMADIRALCWLYTASSETTEALAALAPGTQQEDWWAPAVPEWFGLYAGLEAAASRIRCFEPQFIHGLVQTQSYARAVVQADSRLSAEVVEQRVRFRLERQRTSARITIIMGEAALRLMAGSPEVMTEQLDHLRQVAASIRVMPFAAGAYPRRGSFALLDFDDDEDPPVAYVEVLVPRATSTSRKTAPSTSSCGPSCWRNRPRSRSGSDNTVGQGIGERRPGQLRRTAAQR